MEIFTSRLTRLQVLPRHEISTLTKYQIILARDQFRRNPSSRFEVCILLEAYHLFSFYIIKFVIGHIQMHIWDVMDWSLCFPWGGEVLGLFLQLLLQPPLLFAESFQENPHSWHFSTVALKRIDKVGIFFFSCFPPFLYLIKQGKMCLD